MECAHHSLVLFRSSVGPVCGRLLAALDSYVLIVIIYTYVSHDNIIHNDQLLGLLYIRCHRETKAPT